MSDTEHRADGGEHTRKRRSDGERSRNAILHEAAQLATVEGISGLSIGRLATAVGNQVVANKFGDLTLASDGTKTSPAKPPAEEWKR